MDVNKMSLDEADYRKMEWLARRSLAHTFAAQLDRSSDRHNRGARGKESEILNDVFVANLVLLRDTRPPKHFADFFKDR